MNPNRKPIMQRLRLTVLAVALATCALLLATATAQAATYAVDSCQRPDGSPVGTVGWVASNSGQNTYTGDSCDTGGTLAAALGGASDHGFGDYAEWSFSAPSGTALERVTAARGARVGANQVNGSPFTAIRKGSSALETCTTAAGCSVLEGGFDQALGGAAKLSFTAVCGGAPGYRCLADTTAIGLNKIRITLSDDSSPQLTRAASGSLTSSAARSRVRSLSYNATDVGSGLFRERLVVDGATRLDQQIDAAASCQRHSAGGFSAPRPCTLATGRALDYDTTGLREGEHEAKLEVYDATDTNKAIDGPWTFTVDNLPPSVGEVVVTGIAQEGQALQCAAPVDGQQATASIQWIRAGADGSGQAAIPGATGATYVLAAGDVGKKVLCRITASDGGGASTGSSTVTSGPFADGALVAARPVTPPTGGNDGNGAGGSGTSGTTTSTSSSSTTTGTAGPNGAAGAGGAAGSGGAGGTSASSNVTLAAATANAAPACSTATVTMFSTATSLRRSYNRSRVGMSGRLESRDGSRVGGRMLDIVQTVVRPGSVQRKTIGSVRTAADGRFRTTAPPGPSRALQLVEKGCGSLGRVITERVRGAISSRTTTRRVRNRQSARIRGRVLGGYVGRGIPVELQVKVGRKWRDVKHATTNARGEYKVSYRFLRTYVRYTYSFRIVTRAGGAWPFLPAKSKTVKVRVN